MKNCPSCHKSNDDSAAYCAYCSFPLRDEPGTAILCSAGKHSIPPNWTFCPYCNSAKQGRGSRGNTPEPTADYTQVADSVRRPSGDRRGDVRDPGATHVMSANRDRSPDRDDSPARG